MLPKVISISNGPWAHVALASCVIFGKIYIYLLSNVRKGMWRERNFFTLRKDVDMVHFEPRTKHFSNALPLPVTFLMNFMCCLC